MKNRILLVSDNFNESEKWYYLLQKMGFVVENIRNEAALVAHLLSLRPDAVFIMGQWILLNPIRVLERLKSQSWYNGKVLLFESSYRPINPSELQGYNFDGLLTSQDFSDVERLEIIAQVLDLDFESLYQKYISTFGSHAEPLDSMSQASILNRGSSPAFNRSMDHYLAKKSKDQKKELIPQGFSKNLIDEKLAQLSLGKKGEETSLSDLKREFVKALFKKT